MTIHPRYAIICVMKDSTTPICSHCNDSGFNGQEEWKYKPDTSEWDFCDEGCEESLRCWQSDQDDKAYSHAERCFTDHGYAMGN